MTIDLLNKIYIAWCNQQNFVEHLSADDMLWSDEIINDYQSDWLKRFSRIWDKCEQRGKSCNQT